MKSYPRTARELAKMLEHTVVRPNATRDDILSGAREAVEYGFKCFVVNPPYVKLVKKVLAGSGVSLGVSVGYPSGAHLTAVKVLEAERAVSDGADELDMVLNIGDLKSGYYEAVKKDIGAVVEAAAGRIVKVIIEACYLTDEEKRVACEICCEVPGLSFVKTSTGLGPGGATVHDVALMKKTVGERLGVKAAGGIRTTEDAMAMIEAGATRIGTSRGPAVIEGYIRMLETGEAEEQSSRGQERLV